MFVLFSVAGAMWGLTVHRAKAQAHRIHYLMGVLLAAKTLTLLSQAGMYHLIRSRGHPDGWNFAYYVFTFLRGLLFFTVSCLSILKQPCMHALKSKEAACLYFEISIPTACASSALLAAVML